MQVAKPKIRKRNVEARWRNVARKRNEEDEGRKELRLLLTVEARDELC
jgi:hypothetical protein